MEDPQIDQPVGSPATAAGASKPGHVSVIFFHGIGQQRNYEMTAQLLEGLDDWVYVNYRSGNRAFPVPRMRIRTRSEMLRGMKDSEDRTVSLQADYQKIRVRLYEGYWAPATVRGTSALSAFTWLMRQLLRPIGVLRTPWRSYARLRRSDLLRFASRALRKKADRPGAEDDLGRDARQLILLYRRFVAQREVRRGTFREFADFVRRETDEPIRQARLLALATGWRRWHIGLELNHLATFAFVALAAASGVTLFVVASIHFLAWASDLPLLIRFVPAERLEPTVKNALGLFTLFLSVVGISRFFRDYVGDIQQFVTYEEAQPLYERRLKVLEMAERTLRHVLLDPECRRVVVVAHSLGTSIALDAILRLRAGNQAANPIANGDEVMEGPLPLTRIQHFITCGSPIDKINYFFAALRSTSRSYESLVESLRGDISSAPFSKSGRQPYVHWINFWDRGDPISGPIETVAGDVVREQRVDNVQVASYLWPDPAASHEGYFCHQAMIGTVFGAAFNDEFSFAQCKAAPHMRPAWPWIGPGVASRAQAALLLLFPMTAVVVIWTAIAVLMPTLGRGPFGIMGLMIAAIFLGAQIQRRCRLHLATVRFGARRAVAGTVAAVDGGPARAG
jgi:hypothetical protein